MAENKDWLTEFMESGELPEEYGGGETGAENSDPAGTGFDFDLEDWEGAPGGELPAEPLREEPVPAPAAPVRPAAEQPRKEPSAKHPPREPSAKRAPAAPPPAPAAPRPRKKKKFWLFFLIYTLCILLIGGAGLFVLYQWLDSYEQGRPEHLMEEFMEGKSDDDWLQLMLDSPTLPVTEFEDGEEILRAYFDASCRGGSYTYREAAGVSTKELPVFTVKSGAADVCRVKLRPTESVGFGFHLWSVESAEAYISPYSLSSAVVRIEAPEEETVSLNGVPLDSSYITNPAVPCENLGSFESRYPEPPHRVLYEVSGLYGEITVTDSDGQELAPAESAEGSPILYRLGGDGGYSFKITAPADVKVSVGGVELGEAEIVARDQGLLSGLSAFVDADSDTVTYAAEGLYRRPEITAEAPEGRGLSELRGEEGVVSYTYSGDEELKAQYEEIAKGYFETFMNYSAGRDTAFLPLMNVTLPGTELYTYIQDSTAAMYWASNTKVDYEYLDFTDFISWSADCFSCRVSYKAHTTAESWYEVREADLENVYDMVFVRQNGSWYAAVMNFAL